MPGKVKSKSQEKGKKGKSKAPPPPPPLVLRVSSSEDFEQYITQFRGSALLAIVTPHCNRGTESVVPFMEKLNEERIPLLKDMNIVVMYTDERTKKLCQELDVHSTPAFLAYSYGKLVESFSGANLEKAELIAKIVAQAAEEETARLAAEAKLQQQSEVTQ